MKTKRLSVEESNKLVWTTWSEFLIVGIIVYFFTNPTSLISLLACPIALHALINFWIKSEGIPVKLHSVVPTVFMPTAVFTGCSALICSVVAERILNSWSLGLGAICIVCIMVIYPESRYADYD